MRSTRGWARAKFAGLLWLALSASAPAQLASPAVEPESGRQKIPANYMRALARDQWTIWTSPVQLKREHLPAVVGFAASMALLSSADRSIENRMPMQHAAVSRRASNAGLALLGGAALAFYAAGSWHENPRARETGLLAAEAGLNAWATNSVLQTALGRAEPGRRGGGGFFAGGSSFPSNHSAVAWAMATVIAHEYPGWGTRLLSYGTASAVSATRVSGGRHFASDVVVGGALGWLIGEQIYRRRHEQSFPRENYGTFLRGDYERASDAMYQASPAVPLDSWIYPAMDRLASLGLAPAGFQNLRPWTRLECARLLQEASGSELFGAEEDEAEAGELYRALAREFATETELLKGGGNRRLGVESAYVRSLGIFGSPLTDEMHFAATVVNDYGRPFRKGMNAISGLTLRAEAGAWSIYVRGEYQHSPSAAPLTSDARAAIAQREQLPMQPATAIGQTDRFRLLDAYVAVNLRGWQASFGRQSLWWGPGYGGELTFSNNAEPIPMLRLSSITPFQLPGLLRHLGELRGEGFLGQLDGYHFLRLGRDFTPTGSWQRSISPQPYLWGAKLGLHLTENLEIGASLTTIFAGKGRPLTFDTFLHSFSTRGNNQPQEPGDRRSGFDFRYRIPGLRRWLVLYGNAQCEDQFNPIGYPRHAAMNPGVYLPRLPGARRLDLRFESAYTNVPNSPLIQAYVNAHYAGGFTNHGKILGSWIGPQARAYQLMSTWWLPGGDRVMAGFRRQVVDAAYLGGGQLTDVSAGYDGRLRRGLRLRAGAQYEQWNFPLLSPRGQSNLALNVELSYWPREGR